MGSIFPELNAELNKLIASLIQNRHDLVQAKIVLVQKKTDFDITGKSAGQDKQKRTLFGRNRQNTTKGGQQSGITDLKSPMYSSSTVSQAVNRHSDLKLMSSK
mmetsp:Transcript_10365/g.15951  ORF Transcript_10365/g.15951 Transcript_10365/m.15951 type:complete len:103 (-) Transcript_10365:1762-2070(-)